MPRRRWARGEHVSRGLGPQLIAAAAAREDLLPGDRHALLKAVLDAGATRVTSASCMRALAVAVPDVDVLRLLCSRIEPGDRIAALAAAGGTLRVVADIMEVSPFVRVFGLIVSGQVPTAAELAPLAECGQVERDALFVAAVEGHASATTLAAVVALRKQKPSLAIVLGCLERIPESAKAIIAVLPVATEALWAGWHLAATRAYGLSAVLVPNLDNLRTGDPFAAPVAIDPADLDELEARFPVSGGWRGAAIVSAFKAATWWAVAARSIPAAWSNLALCAGPADLAMALGTSIGLRGNAIIDELLRLGADPFGKCGDGDSALVLATEALDAEIVGLIAARAGDGGGDHFHQAMLTAVRTAIRRGKFVAGRDVVAALVGHHVIGVSTSCIRGGAEALRIACTEDTSGLIVAELLRAGVHVPPEECLPGAALRTGNYAAFRVLAKNADVQRVASEPGNALAVEALAHAAVTPDPTQIVAGFAELVVSGASLAIPPGVRINVLCKAIELGATDDGCVAEMLVTACSPRIEDEHGRLALWYAVERGDVGLADFLLSNGASIYDADLPGEFAKVAKKHEYASAVMAARAFARIDHPRLGAESYNAPAPLTPWILEYITKLAVAPAAAVSAQAFACISHHRLGAASPNAPAPLLPWMLEYIAKLAVPRSELL